MKANGVDVQTIEERKSRNKNNEIGWYYIHILFGNKQTWKEYLKHSTVTYPDGSQASFWSFMGKEAEVSLSLGIELFFDLDALGFSMKAKRPLEEIEKGMGNIRTHLKNQAIFLTEYCLSKDKSIIFYYLGDALHRQEIDLRTADSDLNAAHCVERWLGESLWKEVSEEEKTFVCKVYEQSLNCYTWKPRVLENEITISFSNVKKGVSRFFSIAEKDDFFMNLNMQNRLLTAEYDEDVFSFKDICLTDRIAKLLTICAAIVLENSESTIGEFTGLRKEVKGFRFTSKITMEADALYVSLTEYKEDKVIFDEEMVFDEGSSYGDLFSFMLHESFDEVEMDEYEKIDDALALVK